MTGHAFGAQRWKRLDSDLRVGGGLALLPADPRPQLPVQRLGPNSIETFWLELRLETLLEFLHEIPCTKKMLNKGAV